MPDAPAPRAPKSGSPTAEPSTKRPRRASKAPRRAPGGKRPPPQVEGGIRERLRRDPILFTLCLAFLAFATWAFALTWWVFGGVVPLALAVACVLPAVYLFYVRDATS